MKNDNDITKLLKEWGSGEKEALEKLIPLIYAELHKIAAIRLGNERANHTLQPTALINETFIRLIDTEIAWNDRIHFFAVAANLMRRILIDYARQRLAAKRDGEKHQISLSMLSSRSPNQLWDLLDLNEALEQLALVDPQQSQIVELKFFGGLSLEEIAEVMNISTGTVKREWRSAKMWLMRALKGT